MGLAASQARLLLLTARKSDLEYRAQQITNSVMILAMQTEEVARQYSIKISNQTILYMSTDKDQTIKNITAQSLSALAGGAYRLQCRDADGKYYDWSGTDITYHIGKDGTTITDAQYQALSDEDKANYPTEKVVQGKSDIEGPSILEGYNNGTMQIVYTQDGKEKVLDLNGNNSFTTTYYTDDDKAAEAEYSTKTASIQVKEKRLQNDLNQVETQQKACDTEIDSVKKVMEKNIERTFKVFS